MKRGIETLGILATALTIGGCTTVNDTLDQRYVTDFESCVADGNPILESVPRRCLHNGQYFVEGR